MKSTIVAIFLGSLPLVALAGGTVDPGERALAPGAVHDITGFVGQRMVANKTGSIEGLDIDRYVGMMEKHDTTDWFWIGEQPGKWLESAILTAAAQKDAALEAKARAVLKRMIKAQEPDGYLGITADRVRTPEKPLRGMDPYEQYFTFHALLTAYEVWHDKDALAAATRLGDYYLQHIGPDKAQFWPSPYRPPQNVNTIICEQFTWVPPGTPKAPKLYVRSDIAGHTAHYGLEGTLVVDPILRLYQLGGERRFLDWAKWTVSMIDTWSGWDTFSKLDQVADGTIGVHQLQPYVHAHTFHMNFLGFLRLYQITGDKSLLRKMEGAWNDIASRQVYITGGVSVEEHYMPGYARPMTGHVVETCANMSWLQFNQALLELTGNPRYADAIERLLVNHVFAAQTIDGECNRYHTAPNGMKPDDYFHGPDCCTSSGQRQISMIPQWIYARAADAVIVNQFVPSTADFAIGSGRVTLVQETTYPEGETVELKVHADAPATFTLKLRLPAWCERPRLAVNGQTVGGLKPGTYQALLREWRSGDTVELSLPMTTRWVKHDHFAGPDAPYALVRGPVVYALDTVWWDPAKLGAKAPSDVGMAAGLASMERPQTVPTGPRSIGPFLSAAVKLASQPATASPVQAIFVPFSNVGRWYPEGGEKPDKRSRTYSYATWLFDAASATYKANAREAAKVDNYRTEAFDFVLPGDPGERAHGLEAAGSHTGSFSGRTFHDGQSFGYTLAVPTEMPSKLLVTYWGGETVERRFDVLVNGRKIATERLLNNNPGRFYEQSYDVPFDLIKGRTDAGGQKVDKITVRFLATPGSIAGGVFGVRTMARTQREP